MKLVLNKYDILQGSNVCQANTMEEIKIFSLCADINRLKYANLNLVQVIVKKGSGKNKFKSNKNRNNHNKDKQNNRCNNSKFKYKWGWKKNPTKEV